jgi:uncharacterized protein (TIGR02147 family)
MKMIIDGQRNLSFDVMSKLISALELTDMEARFFERLVKFTQIKNLEAKNELFEELLEFKKFRQTHHLTQFQYDFYSSWWMPVLYELIGFVSIDSLESELCSAFGIKTSELALSLQKLERLGLIKKIKSRWKKTNVGLETDHETASMNVRNFQKVMIQKSQERLDEVDGNNRDYQTLTIALTKADFQELKTALYKFVQKMNRKYSGEAEPDFIYQMNVQLFPAIDLALKKQSSTE